MTYIVNLVPPANLQDQQDKDHPDFALEAVMTPEFAYFDDSHINPLDHPILKLIVNNDNMLIKVVPLDYEQPHNTLMITIETSLFPYKDLSKIKAYCIQFSKSPTTTRELPGFIYNSKLEVFERNYQPTNAV